jgi:ADP-ribosylglycohydrolase
MSDERQAEQQKRQIQEAYLKVASVEHNDDDAVKATMETIQKLSVARDKSRTELNEASMAFNDAIKNLPEKIALDDAQKRQREKQQELAQVHKEFRSLLMGFIPKEFRD